MMRVWTGWGSRLFLHFIFVLTMVFIMKAADGNRRQDSVQGDGDTLTNQELHRLLSLFNTTPKPSSTTPATSFVPTEVIPPQTQLQQKLQQLQQALKIQRQLQVQQQQPRPTKNIVRRKDLQKAVNRNGDAASTNLLQQLSVLSSFLEASGVQAQQGTTPGVQPVTESTTTTAVAPPSNAPSLPVDDQAAALQSLALLSALLGGAGNTGNNAANLATLLGADSPAPSSPVIRQAQPQQTNSNNDPTAAALTNLLLAQAGLSPQQLPQNSQTGDQQQNFQTFANSQANLDPAASNQLSGLLGLLGTLGTLGNLAGGGSQAPSLFNFGQQQQQPNILQSLMSSQQQQQPSSTNAFANLFGGNNQQQQQNNILANLLGGQQGSSNSLFSQPQQQPPGVLASLGNLGSSLFSVAGSTLGGLSGTRGDGKPRVRGVDTRLGLGYRLGQNADAQVMMEIGPQLFTEAIPGEHRPGVPPNGVASNTLRDIRQPSTELVQQLLQEELEKQKDIQRRHQIQQLTKEEIEHQRIGQLFHVKPYYNPPNRAPNPPLQRRQQPPNRFHQMFPYPQRHQHHPPQQRFRPPMNPYYRNMLPPTVLEPRNHNHNQWNNIPRNNYPLNYNMQHAGPWNNNFPQVQINNPNPFNSIERQSRPTEASRPISKPKPSASSESEPYSMLTEYEKWLVKRGASAQGLGPSSSLSKRMLPFNDENSELSRGSLAMADTVPKPIPKTQFSFHGAREPSSAVNIETKIVRMSQKRPATLKSETFANRVGNVQGPPRPSRNFRRPNPNPSVMPPFRHPQSGLRNSGYPMPHVRRNTNAGRWQLQPHVRRHQGIPNGPGGYPRSPIRRSDPQPTQAPIEHNYNPFQNFVMEADDSFLRRNAQAHIQNEKMESSGSSPGVSVTVNVIPKPAASVAPVSKGVPAMEAAVKAGSTAFNVFKEVIKPAVKYFMPSVDSLHPFSNLNDYENGDYTPTKEPVLIATPTPTPVPSLYDHMGKKNPNHPDQTPEEQASAVVHVGEGLTYGDLASSLRISTKGKKRKKKPGKDSAEESDEAESRDDGPVNAPGVEMFIDIESGELSVRKPIASLTHFGEVTTTTTLKPEPKTEDEIEDEESGKIFERLQEHFKSEYDNFQVTQAALQAAKERKEKIKKEQDESLGLVNRYFDLLNDGDEGTDINRRRKRVDSVRISGHMN